ncbi:histidine kinase [Kitasatospora sp. HPMI-4]|uniref:histidine kinase n=1 Tax=Kitasatospora sp. HPMI-4 TaxID=3448443 RepID=UPI003F1E3027
MTWGIRPLLRGSTYTGVLFAFPGAAASTVLLPFAVLPALLRESGPYGVRAALVPVVWAGLIAAAGLARTTGRVLIAGARRLLAAPLPESAGPPGVDWRRTPLWLLLHVAAGWSATLTANLLLAAPALPGRRLGDEAKLSLFGRTLRSGDGWASWAAALLCVLPAALVCVAVSGVLRRLAPRLLGPSPAERLAPAAARERRLAERNRLARELHDPIGHTLTAATIQAAVVGEVLTSDPMAARAALRGIEESTRAASEDLDYVLGVLREEAAGTAPARTPTDLPELLDRLRHTGTVVEPDLSGDLARVPAALSRAAYRDPPGRGDERAAARRGRSDPRHGGALARRPGPGRGQPDRPRPERAGGLPDLRPRTPGPRRTGAPAARRVPGRAGRRRRWVLEARLPVRTPA